MRENEKILFPAEEEREQSIQKIVAEGTPMPRSLWAAMCQAWRCVGVRGLFCGVEDCVFLALLGAGLIWTAFLGAFEGMFRDLYLPVFLVSPVFYAALYLLSFWKEQMAGTYEQLMVCRLSLRQMTVLRGLCFGSISLVATGCLSVGVWIRFGEAYPPIRMLGISSAALFLFAWMSLAIEWEIHTPRAHLYAPLAWLAGGIGLLVWDDARTLLPRVPTVVFLLAAVLFARLYLRELKKYYFKEKEGALAYVVG